MLSLAEKYFLFVNGALSLVGVALVGYSAYLSYELGEISEVVGAPFIFVPLAFGVGLLVTGIIGCCAAKKNIKALQIFYFVFAVVLLLVVLGMGVTITAIAGEIDQVKGGEAIEGDIMAEITDAQIVLFNKCCAEVNNISRIDTLCSDTVTTACISDEDDVEAWEDYFSQESCDILADVEINGAPIVGDLSENSEACGGGNFETFSEAITTYITDNFNTFGGVTFGLSIALTLLVLSSCCLIFCKKTPKDENKNSGGQIEAGKIAN